MAKHGSRRQSSTRSRQIREQTIGTHVSRNSARAKHTNLQFGSTRKTARAARGEITHVVPDTYTGESVQDFTRRVNMPDYAETERRVRRKRRRALVATVVLVALLAAGAVAWLAYGSTVDRQMRLDDTAAVSALAAPSSEQEPYWMLVVGEYEQPGAVYAGPNVMTLLHVDPLTRQVGLLSVPPDVQVALPGGGAGNLAQAQVAGGDAGLIQAVSSFADVPIAHLVRVNQDGFAAIVDELGGIEVTLPEEIDDPAAGYVYLPAGPAQLDGALAVQAVRATNYVTPEDTQAAVQNAVLLAVLEKIRDHGGLDSAVTFDAIAHDFRTDLTFAQISNLIAPFAGDDAVDVTLARVPGSRAADGAGVVTFSVDREALALLVAQFDVGEKPADGDPTAGAADPGNVTVTVRNGTSITGAAGTTATLLAGLGYVVGEPGNTEAAVYDETLVVYRDEAYAPTAEAIVAAMGCGRATDASMYYTFDTDILVVIGADWVPIVVEGGDGSE